MLDQPVKNIALTIIILYICGCDAYVGNARVATDDKYADYNYLIEVTNKTEYPISVKYIRVSVDFKDYDMLDDIMPNFVKIIKVKREEQSAKYTVVYGGLEKNMTERFPYFIDKAKVDITYSALFGFQVEKPQ